MYNTAMVGYLETSRQVTAEVGKKLGELPELSPTLGVVLKNTSPELFGNISPEMYIGQTFVDYLRIIKDLATLDNPDLKIIERAEKISQEKGTSSDSAANNPAKHFLETLGPDRRQKLLSLVLASSDINSIAFKTALSDLSERMLEGHELAGKGVPLKDGASPEADFAIWGHTKGLKPKAMIHLVICHFLARTFTAQFAGDSDKEIQDLIRQKDALINAMGKVIYLRAAQNKIAPEIATIWKNERGQGGLRWSNSDKQEIYNRVVNEI